MSELVTNLIWREELRLLKDLKPHPNNPRRISKEAFNKLVKNIKECGYIGRITINHDNLILGGNQRLKALQHLTITEIPVLVPSRPLTTDEEERIHITDNISAGEWDTEILANSFDQSQLIEWGMPENVFGMGVEVEEIETTEADNEVPELPQEPITKLGDIWLLGEHRLMCGDSCNIQDIEKLMDAQVMDMVYTDPPYGIGIVRTGGGCGGLSAHPLKGSVAQKGTGLDRHSKSKNNVYDIVIGDDTNQTAIDSYNLCAALEIKTMIWWGGNYYASALPNTGAWIVWDKENTKFFADCELAWTNTASVARIFKHMWNGMIKASEHGQKRVHPTQKPIELALWCFKEYGADAKTVLDLFGGSGSTLIACEKASKKCFMMELSPAYCDVIIARWEKLTGKKAELLS